MNLRENCGLPVPSEAKRLQPPQQPSSSTAQISPTDEQLFPRNNPNHVYEPSRKPGKHLKHALIAEYREGIRTEDDHISYEIQQRQRELRTIDLALEEAKKEGVI